MQYLLFKVQTGVLYSCNKWLSCAMGHIFVPVKGLKTVFAIVDVDIFSSIHRLGVVSGKLRLKCNLNIYVGIWQKLIISLILKRVGMSPNQGDTTLN